MIMTYDTYRYWRDFNHRLVEMQICAEEQGFFEEWGTMKGITLQDYLVMKKVVEEELENDD